jgi:hypothetical protein
MVHGGEILKIDYLLGQAGIQSPIKHIRSKDKQTRIYKKKFYLVKEDKRNGAVPFFKERRKKSVESE